ncbi:MAG: hypothetical protein QME81_00205 [bacterium]|nr:hypothetical protein [bacterium]
MITISIEDEWIETAQLFGNVKNIVKKALRAYSVEQCQQRINQATTKIASYVQKYDCEYETFTQAVQTDKDFLTKIETQDPLWEEDAMEWKYWVEEQQAWRNQLEAILRH